MTGLLSAVGIELNLVSQREKIISALGGCLAMAALLGITSYSLGGMGGAVLVGSMAASAVLLFAVPHGQLSQPWPVIAGHGCAALIGVACSRFIPLEWLAGAVAVGLTIGAMHQLKCIHPPGGATALSAVIGGDSIHRLGFKFVLFPVLSNAVAMVAIAVAFNWWFPWRRYPTALGKSPAAEKKNPAGEAPSHEDIVKALRSLDSFVDVTEEDLVTLSKGLARERQARMLRAKRTRTTKRSSP